MRNDLAVAVVVGLQTAFVAIAVGFRGWLQYRRTKDLGFRGTFKRDDFFGWLGAAFYLLCSVLALLAEFTTWIEPRTIPTALVAPGLALALGGMALSVLSQLQMRDSWRIGVDEREVTALVTCGIFAYVRNPIFSGLLLVNAGIVLILPNVFSGLALISVILLVEYQVRFHEEPYLARIHGRAYMSYAKTVGRFVPRVGLLR